MPTVYYACHGHTRDLATRHPTLTERGITEAHATGMLLWARDIKPDLIVCSNLPQAVQSANIVAEVVGYAGTIRQNSELNEQLWGGGETVKALQVRATSVVAWLKKLDKKVVFVMGHEAIGRAIIRTVERRPYTDEGNDGRSELDHGQIVRIHPQPTLVLK